MKLSHLVPWGLAAALLAGCGGAGTSAVNPSPSGGMGTASLIIDISRVQGSSAMRQAKFIGTGVNKISYDFHPSSGSDVTATGAALTCSGNSCSISVPLASGSWTLQSLQVLVNSTAVGNQHATQSLTINVNQTSSASVAIDPVLSNVTVTSAANLTGYANGQKVLWVDGTSQTLTATVTEVDPVGDVIYSGTGNGNAPVDNWPTISFSDGSLTGITLPGSITTPPTTSSGSSVNFVYNGGTAGQSGPASSVNFSVTDGTNTATTGAINFVSLTYTGPTAGAVTVTESNAVDSALTISTDASGSTDCTSDGVTFVPALGASAVTLTAGAGTIAATATSSTAFSCNLYVTSPTDPNLKITVPLTNGSGGLTITSHLRR